ncbi:MAG: hypothetical protein KGM96_04740 [Acidobacteriota bacterium]|nr:hypothetical protein [Acidobacteriota bacterium]
MALATHINTQAHAASLRPVAGRARALALRTLAALLAPALALLAGCGGAVTANPAQSTFSLWPGTASIDTNCTGCNATDAHGRPVHQFAATLTGGGAAAVTWSLSGGDAIAGPGTISAAGRYTPPSYLTADRVQVMVTAALNANPGIRASSVLTLTPGFLRPLTPENLALGANGTATITGYLAQAGGGASIYFALADTPTGSSGGQGSLSAPHCERSGKAFTACSVTYTAPAVVPATSVTYIVATTGSSPAKTEAVVLLNTAGVASNPTGHQAQLATPMQLGSSGGNNGDFDLNGNTIIDCCSGTLGSLIQDGSGRQFLLSNNHVLARSDHASVGDAIVQPGLIDNNCTPNGEGPGTVPVGSLTGWLPLSASQTNTDAAIAQVASRTVDATGNILELGTRMPDGTLAAAPPGISSTGGKGEAATLALRVAKSGRTTGLTCGGVSAVSVDIAVNYYRDCGETKPYLTKTFTNQLAVSGDRFSDAGDSGALVVDASNAEPVGLFFAGGTDAAGVGQGVASPAPDVLSELSTLLGSGANFTFVGGADHPVSCLSFGDSTVRAAQARALPDTEIASVQQALAVARALVNPDAGILGVAMGKSSDQPGEAAVIIYVDENAQAAVPATVDGVRTLVIATNARAVALGAAPMANTIADAPALTARALNQGLATKRQWAHTLMQQNPAFFGVGVGQSLDNPREAALVIYVDRRHLPAQLPATVGGLRTRYVVMDRMHVTRSYAAPYEPRGHCLPHAAWRGAGFDPSKLFRNNDLHLF